MHDTEMKEQWMESMNKEIEELEKKEVWEIVPIQVALDLFEQVVPSTWTLRYKRYPDGSIKKCKARFCMRGDLQNDTETVYSPVVAFSTVRLFLTLSLVLGWETCTIDFSNAFVQAKLQSPVYLHLPRGFMSPIKGKCCLKLKRSLYGSCYAPKLWFEHLFKFLIDEEKFIQSEHDQCLLYKPNMIVIIYVDDAGITAPSMAIIDAFLDRLKDGGFDLTKEGSFSEYLGIQYDEHEGSITMTQKGLINKIIATAGMEECNPNKTPTQGGALAMDPEGEHMTDAWSYRSIVGMLLYLACNTRPDIVFAVSQVARFSHEPKKSHATAVKAIIRYLKGSNDQGTVFKHSNNLDIKCFVDADFSGLFNQDPPEESSSAKSRTGYIISVGDCYLLSKSQLQTTISLSTSEAEYYALSQAMRAVIPIRALVMEVVMNLALTKFYEKGSHSIKTIMYEDNSSALSLATNHQVTSRTKHYLVKWHFFWSHIKTKTNPDGTILI